MSDPKRVTATKRSSLAGLSEGWGDECYAIVTPATYVDQVELDSQDLPSKSQQEQVDFQFDVIRRHFLTGKIKVWNEDGEQELTTMVVDDCFASVAIADKIYADIMGFELDPKDIRALVESPQPTSADNTEPPLSTAPSESTEPSPKS